MGRWRWSLGLMLFLQAWTGCHRFLPFSQYSPDGPSPSTESSPAGSDLTRCGEASSDCWDIIGTFSQTDFELPSYPPQIFGRSVTDGEPVYALLDGSSDDTFRLREKHCFYPPPGPRTAALTWHIERQVLGPDRYLLRVRGGSDADCDYNGNQPVCAGEVRVNPARGWKVQPLVDGGGLLCSVSPDNATNGVLIETYCLVDPVEGRIRWKAGSGCNGCCACPDGAGVTIAVALGR